MEPRLPAALAVVADLPVESPTTTWRIHVARPTFIAYTGTEAVDNFGGKDLLLVDGRPQFAEVAILRAFEAEGWVGRWVETYQRPAMYPALLRAWNGGTFMEQEQRPIEELWVNNRLQTIVNNNGSFSGCWDVVAWKGDRLVFAESKKQKGDRMRDTQVRWMEAALSCGCVVEDFLVVEWSLT